MARPTYASCGKMVVDDAKKALAMVRHVRGMLNTEFKNHDVAVTATGIVDGSGTITQLTNIPQGSGGTTTEQRDGANVKITSIYIKLLAIMSASGTNSSFRLMLVEDRQTNQAIYATADLLTTVVNVSGLVSTYNLQNQFRFKVLYDKVHTIDINGKGTKFIKIYKKVKL